MVAILVGIVVSVIDCVIVGIDVDVGVADKLTTGVNVEVKVGGEEGIGDASKV